MLNRIKGRLSNRILVPFFALIAITLLSMGSTIPGTKARTRQEHDIIYYTDATYSVQCGYYVFPCYGGIHQSGCVTQYYDESWYDCGGPK